MADDSQRRIALPTVILSVHGRPLFVTIDKNQIAIVPITLQNLPIFKAVRLRALRESPSAFGSTFARESGFSDADWTQRARRWAGETGIGFVAMDGVAGCGLAGSLVDEADESRAQLVSMWTAPTHRRRGIGARLVAQIVGWARSRGATELQLMVTSNNDRAIAFYERLGFVRTGQTEPYPNDPALLEYEMIRPLS